MSRSKQHSWDPDVALGLGAVTISFLFLVRALLKGVVLVVCVARTFAPGSRLCPLKKAVNDINLADAFRAAEGDRSGAQFYHLRVPNRILLSQSDSRRGGPCS
jgi:hypothetical protein